MPLAVALDVAILPPAEVGGLAVALSRRLPPEGAQGLVLGGERRPHVTLTQQFVHAGDLDAVRRAVGVVLDGQPALPLRVVGGGRRGHSLWLEIETTPALAALHARLMDALAPYERMGDGEAFTGEAVRPNDVAWVRTFRQQAAYDHFTPHITIGHGAAAPDVEPFSFTATEVAACHLGRFCTARTVFERWPLGRER